MEQHLLAYLTTKYGVRQLITQWLISVLAAVEHFAPLDAQTALFGKVIRNAVEEEFEEAQLRVKATAGSLLHTILQVVLSRSLLPNCVDCATNSLFCLTVTCDMHV